jgi:L-lactate dehydrogenase complex protein LldG
MGMGWTAIIEGVEKASALSHFCLLCGRCKEVCPINIDMPKIIRDLKNMYFRGTS